MVVEKWDDELNKSNLNHLSKEYYQLKEKLWFEWVPADANKCSVFYHYLTKINPYYKSTHRRGLATKEYGVFEHICEYGEMQVIRCYKYENKDMSALDFAIRCCDCPHFGSKEKIISFSDDLIRILNLETSKRVVEKENSKIRLKKYDHDLKVKNSTASYVYFISNGQHVKIGVADRPNQRLKELQTGSSMPLEILKTIECKNHTAAMKLEGEYHKKYKNKNTCGEWFDILEEVNSIA